MRAGAPLGRDGALPGKPHRAQGALLRKPETFSDAAARIEEAWVDLGATFSNIGEGLIVLYDKIRIAMNTFGETTVSFVRPSLDSVTAGADAAAKALDKLLDKLSAYAGLTGALSRVPGLGFLSGLSGILGIAGGILNPLNALGFIGGGGIPDAPIPIPEPSNPMFPSIFPSALGVSGLSLNINVGPAHDPFTAARDAQWQRALQEGIRELGANGFSTA